MHIWARPGIRIAAAWAPSVLLALAPVSSFIFYAGIALSATLTVVLAMDMAIKRVRCSIDDAAERVCRRVDAATDRLSREVLGREETYMRFSRSFAHAIVEALGDNESPGKPFFFPVDITRN